MTAINTNIPADPAAPKSSLWHRLYNGETTFDFVGRRKIGFGISAIAIVLSIISLIFSGLNLGIDFEGGVAWEFTAGQVTTGQVDGVLNANGIDTKSAKVQTLSGSDGDRLRVQVGDQPAEVQAKIKQEFATLSGSEVSDNVVSPTWGDEITKKAIQALVAFFVILSAFISWRFEWKMAVAAIVAVAHDVFISVGIYSLFGFEVTPATVIAFLTILGFSLYDTIVVFDKVQENTQKFSGRAPYSDIVNLSMNQVLMRSLNTSLAAVLPVLSILVVGGSILGAVSLQDFALALLVGLITGSYSSIFIATPVLALLKEREPKYRNLKNRAAGSGDLVATRARSAAGGVPAIGGSIGGAASTPKDPTAALTHPPRPRKKRRR